MFLGMMLLNVMLPFPCSAFVLPALGFQRYDFAVAATMQSFETFVSPFQLAIRTLQRHIFGVSWLMCCVYCHLGSCEAIDFRCTPSSATRIMSLLQKAFDLSSQSGILPLQFFNLEVLFSDAGEQSRFSRCFVFSWRTVLHCGGEGVFPPAVRYAQFQTCSASKS